MGEEQDVDLQWYVLRVRGGKEKEVKAFLESKRGIFDAEKVLDEVFINTREYARIIRGKKKIVEENQYRGYIFVHTDMSDQRVINLLKNTPHIVKVGPNSKERLMLTKRDVDKLFKKTNDGQEGNVQNIFVVGDTVKIKEGCFTGFHGKIVSIDHKTQHLILIVSVFSTNTEVRVSFSEVENF